jgi:opacity protein-like surface antigen
MGVSPAAYGYTSREYHELQREYAGLKRLADELKEACAEVRDLRAAEQRRGRTMRRIAVCLLAFAGLLAAAVVVLALPAGAASPNKQGKIAAPPKYESQPYTAPEELPAYNVHNWYAGLAGGYAWTPEYADDTWHGGVYGGYLWRPNAVLGLGFEADYMLRDLGQFQLDDGIASLRGRLGVFFAPGTFLYGTAGISHATAAFVPDGFRKGLVVGGGIEKDLGKNLALRLEVLHYRHTDEYLGWDSEVDGTTALRLGAAFKF